MASGASDARLRILDRASHVLCVLLSGRVKLVVYTMNRLTAVTNHLRTATLPTEVANAPVGAGGYEDEYRVPGAPCSAFVFGARARLTWSVPQWSWAWGA